MQRAKFSLASVLWLFAASAALAQTNDVSPNGAGVVSLEDNFSGTASLGQGAYIDVRNMAGSGVGYRNGYTQVGGFIPLWGSDDWFIAPQARLIITDTQRVGANIGAVARRYVSDWDRIVGANVFYDYDESYLSNHYHQVGFGFETLGEWWDARGNVYLPVSNQSNNMGPVGLDSSLYYIQNQIAARGYDLIEQSLKGGDVELGVPVLASTPWLRAFGGAYFYSGDGHNPVGVRGRVDANISNDLLVGLNVTHDNVYGTNLNAVVDFRFSGFLPTRYFPKWTTQERMLTQVQRNWRITTDRYQIAKDIPVINPRDDQPYFVVHVDSNNTGAGAGTGTAEDPYHNLPGPVPAGTDLVLVQRGQSTQAAPYTGNIQLVDNARLLGEGKAHIFDGYVNYGSFSHVYNDAVLPGFSDSGLYPFLSNPAGDIVTLANHNEVSAFVMQDASNRAIYGNGVDGFHLNNLEIAGNAGGGIVLQNAIGSGIVTLDGQTVNSGLITDINRNNTVVGYTQPTLGAGNNAAGGILIDTGVSPLTLGIDRVSMNAAAPGTQAVGIQLTADDGNLLTTLNEVIAGGNTNAGVILNQTGGTTLTAGLTNVTVSNNLGDGLQVNGDGGTTNVTASAVVSNGNDVNGISITGINNAQMGLAFTGGSATGSDADGLRISGTTGADIVVGVTDFPLTGNGQSTVNAANVRVNAASGATATLTMSNSAAGFAPLPSVNDDFGLVVGSTGALSVASVSVTGGSFDNAGVNAVNVLGTAGGTVNINLDSTTGNAAVGTGFLATADGGTVNLEIENNSNFNTAGGYGLDVAALNGGTLNMAVASSTFTGSGLGGIRLSSADTGTTVTANLDTVTANSNQLSGLSAVSDDFAVLNLRVLNSIFNQNGLGGPLIDGVSVVATNDSTSRTLFYNTTSSSNSGDGFGFDAQSGSYLSTRLDTITASNNLGYGVNFNASGASDAYLITEGVNTISGNALGAYNVNYANVNNAVAALVGSANNSAGDGFNVTMTNITGAALVTLDGGGTGTIDGNAGHGVNISINGADQAGVLIEGYASISNNGDVAGEDGIHIDLQNITTAAAIDLLGVSPGGTTMDDNFDDAIDINLNTVTLGTFVPPAALATVSVLSRTDSVALPNESDPPLLALPLPVNINIGTITGYPTSNGILVDGFDISTAIDVADPNANGILITGNTITGTGDITVQNNTVGNSQGNGIYTVLNNATIDQALYLNNTVFGDGLTGNQFGDGIRFEMTGGTLGTVGVGSSTVTDQEGYGVNIDLNGVGGLGSVIVDGNDIQRNTGRGLLGSGIFVNADNTDLTLIQVTNNDPISNNFGDGVRIFGTNSAIGTVNISDNVDISSNTFNGINVGMVDSPIGTLHIENNTVTSFVNPATSFNIDLTLIGMTPQQAAIFTAAAQRWEQIITGDIPDTMGVDDVEITAEIAAIDGAGGILGFAGPDAVRPVSFLPYLGSMTFDSADINSLILAGQFDEVILHEMGHVLGFGTIWQSLGLLNGAGTSNPQFNGAFATAEYNARFGLSATTVPVEGNGVPGTTDAHWRESTFDNELMTGYLNGGVVNPISTITVGQFADLGYTVNLSQADPYLIAPSATVPDYTIIHTPFVVSGTGGAVQGSVQNVLPSLASNQQNGINIDLTRSDVTTTNILTNQILGNGVNGVLLTADDSALTTLTIDGNEISQNANDGIQLSLNNTSSLATTVISDNAMDANGENGVNVLVSNSNLGTMTVAQNQITNSVNGDGFRMIQPDDTDELINLAFLRNQIDGNANGRGVNIELPYTDLVTPANSKLDTILNLSFENDSITNNGLEGVRLDLTGSNNLQANNVTANVTIASNSATPNPYNATTSSQFNGNGDSGFHIIGDGTSDVTLGVGGDDSNTFNANGGPGLEAEMAGDSTINATIQDATFLSNTDAGIGFRLNGSSDAIVNMDNVRLSNTTNGADVDFNGEGFTAVLRGSSTITGSLTASTVTSNAGDGVRFDARGNNSGTFTRVNNFTIGGVAAEDGNTITGNTGNGISVLRTADAEINNMRILNNTVDGNADGLYILAANANKLDTYTVDNNSFSNNALDGILIDERADADVSVNMDLNTITGNGLNGVHLIEQINAGSDSRSLTGAWTRNTITGNSQNGILLSGVTSGLVIGNASNLALGNDISLNLASGVHVNGAGSLLIGSNLIEQNGTLSDLGTANEDAGVYLNVAPFSDITVVNNDIVNNNGDGVQYGIATGFNGFSSDIAIVDNNISNNAGRGIDLINRGSNFTDATITGNIVNSNGLEGVYIVNTSSTTQNQFASSTTALDANGSVFASPVLRLLFSDNQVRANGLNSPATTTGLYLRVGTSDGGGGTGDDGGFASNGGFTVNPFGAFPTRGGVIASVFGNEFGGNFGDDIKFSSFVSTVDPAASAGTWGDTISPTVINTYQSDPLARLDLYFGTAGNADLNTYDSNDVNNTNGASGIPTANPTNVAFYNNTEGTFKSRTTGTGTAPTFNGPFTSATRRRNAQRQAGVFPDADSQPNGTSFLYPGVGASTFRVNTTDGSFFIDDTFPYTGFIWGGSITGEIGYSWGTLP